MGGDPTVTEPGHIHLDQSRSPARILLLGDWTLAHYSHLCRQLEQHAEPPQPATIELHHVGALDTAGAALLARWLGATELERLAAAEEELPAERRNLLQAIATAHRTATRAGPTSPSGNPLAETLAGIGRITEHAYQQITLGLGFSGQVLLVLAGGLLRPWRWRLSAVSRQLQHTALEAIPIVALLTFAIGAVIALLGISLLGRFDAEIFAVDLVTYAFLREFGVVITAILLAGRSASAFAAQIGSMKANEEIDALRTQGLDPVDLLVAPRVVAMLIALPLLTVVGVLAGIAGGSLVIATSVDITYARIIGLVQEAPLEYYLAGLAKAPIFAYIIAVIGCLEGFKCGGSAQSVGQHTTSAVVQSIFWVIILNAAAALFFLEVGW